jgi:hypothetical protein
MAPQRRVPLAIFNPIRFDARVRPNRLLLAAALGAVLSATAAGQSGQSLWKPPVAAGTNVSVWHGDRVGVALRGFHGNNPVEYVIDRPPRHGRLSPVLQPDPDRVSLSTDGSVTYVHDGAEDGTKDEFTFRVRGLRGGLSSPATVRIDIRDRPPVLLAPAALEFEAAAGETMTLPLELGNAGGGVLSVENRAEPPFEIIGPPRFALARGQSTALTVRYTPASPGQSARQVLRLGVNDSAGTQTVLLGRSRAPFEVTAERPEFTLAGRSREARLVLQSRAGLPQEIGIAVEPPDLVATEARVTLAPGAARTLDLRIPENRKGERRDVRVTFSTPFHRSELTLAAPPVPADLTVLGGELDFTRNAEAGVTVTNAGGVPGRFTIEPAAGLKLSVGGSPDSREFTVEPDSAQTVMLRLETGRGIVPAAAVTVHAGRGAPVELPVKARAPDEGPAVTREATAEPVPPPQAPRPWQLNRDVSVADTETPRRLEWRTALEGWRGVRLEFIEDGVRSEYTPANPPRGWIERLGDRLADFFRGLVRGPRDKAPDSEPVPPEWTDEEIDAAAAGEASRRWILTAHRGDPARREPVSDPFRIIWEATNLEVSPETPAPARASGTTVSGTKQIPLALEMKDARAETQRHSARVQVIFARDPGADAYRLEHGFSPTVFNPATGLPYAGDFRPAPHPAEVKVLGTKDIEHEGRELTVLTAEIEGLDAGTASTWRIVTMAGGRDRWPTGEFVVSTKPPWRIPWRGVLLSACLAALAGVLYLRWRLGRPPP